jgi:uncharacterized damage-inducible protein DinB
LRKAEIIGLALTVPALVLAGRTGPGKGETTMPKIAELLLAELEREAAGTRRTLERVPEGCNDWKPHEKSMPFGYLAGLVATMLSWVEAIITQDELDLEAPGEYKTGAFDSNRELLDAFDKAVAQARKALATATDEHLLKTSWRLLAQGRLMTEQPRYVAIRDLTLNHLAHHRGQLTVYLRLNDVPVLSLYGPTADENPYAGAPTS